MLRRKVLHTCTVPFVKGSQVCEGVSEIFFLNEDGATFAENFKPPV